jgi:isoleucyl-tRNA synthetase
LNDYDPTKAARYIEEFVGEELSNWFVRLSRRRFWKGEMNEEKKVAYDTLYTCLNTVSIIMSPIAPFFADWLYKSLNYAEISNNKAAISVHLTNWPSENTDLINESIENQMKRAQTVCSLVLSLRKKEKIRVRQPLQKIIIPVLTETMKDELKMVEHIILSEVNVKEIEYLSSDHNLIVKKVKPNFKVLGKKLGPHMKTVADKIAEFTQDHIQRLENNELIDILDLPIEFSLALEDVEITAQDMPGWLVSNQGDTTVALDITISEILQKEGIARELINRIQNLRKSQDFDITDIISIHYNSDEEIINTINEFNSYICQEVLASEILLDTSINLNETEVYEKPIFLQLIKK